MSVFLGPHREMGDSVVPWLGEIPRHWDVKPARALFTEVKDQNHPDEPLLSVTIAKGIIRQDDLLADTSKKDSSNQDKSKYKLVQLGDVAYNKMRAWQGAVGCSAYRGIVSPAYIVQRPRDGVSGRFMHYLLRTPQFAKEAERWSYGITSDQWSLRPEHFKMIYCCLPPWEEQESIVRFLDHATRQIGKAIRAKQKLVKLLEDQKQAIIHHAVTRGLDRNVRLKPSGIEWLGDVPEHWEAWPITYFAKVGNGSTPSRGNTAYWSAGTYPWLNSSAVNTGIITRADQFVTPLALNECHLPRVAPSSVLVAITGQGRTRGRTAIVTIEATINQHVAFITPRVPNRIVTTEFLWRFLGASYAELRRISDDSGSTKGALTCEDLKHFRVLRPPISEQLRITQHISDRTDCIASTQQATEREITLLREYRARLIADVVTGKLDVREAAARLPKKVPAVEAVDEAEAWAEAESADSDGMDEAAIEEAGT